MARAYQEDCARARPSAWVFNSRCVAARDKSRPGRRAMARAHQEGCARSRPSAWVLNSRCVAARDKSRPWRRAMARAYRENCARARPSAWVLKSRPRTAAERRACASRWNATAPEAGAGLFPDFRGRKLAGHGAERCEVKRCGIQAANVSMAAIPAPCRPLSENRPGPCLRAAPGMTTALALFSRLCRLRP